MSINSPILNGTFLYVGGLQVSKSGNQTLAITPGAARNSTDVNDIDVSGIFNITAITVNGAALGKNGCDVAVLAASSSYYLHLIGDSTKYNLPAGLISQSIFSPSLPMGYDMFRRIGFFRTDGSANILTFYQSGGGIDRQIFFDVGLSILSGGTATTFTAVQLGTSVPATSGSGLCWLDLTYTPSAAGHFAEFLPGGSTATNGLVRFGTGVAATQVGQVCVPFRTLSGVPQIEYKVTATDSLTIVLQGYSESLYAISEAAT